MRQQVGLMVCLGADSLEVNQNGISSAATFKISVAEMNTLEFQQPRCSNAVLKINCCSQRYKA